MMRPVDRTSSDPSLLTQRQGHRRAVSDAGSLLGRGVAPQTNTAHLALQTLDAVSLASWDALNDTLSGTQHDCLELLATTCQASPLPTMAIAGSVDFVPPPQPSSDAPPQQGKAARQHASRTVLRDAAQFYSWHNELMEAAAVRRDEQYKQYALLLEAYLQACQNIVTQIDALLATFDDLTGKQQESRRKVVTVLDAYRHLEGECHALQKVVEGLSLRTAAVPLHTTTTGIGVETTSPFRQHSTSSSALGMGWGTAQGTTTTGALSPSASATGPMLSGGPTLSGGPSSQQQQGMKAEGDSLTGWISSTLGIDEATVTSYLPKLW